MPSTRTHGRLSRAALCVAVAVGLVAAYSTASLAGASVSSAKSTSCAKPSGQPILVSHISGEKGQVSVPFFASSARASVKSINCAGGVDGRPLQLVFCNADPFTDPNQAVNCAREAIKKGVVASVGDYVTDGNVVQAFNDAGIPTVGNPLNFTGFAASHSYTLGAGIPGNIAGSAAYLWDHGARHIRAVILDSPASGAIANFANLALQARGGKMLDPVLYPSDASADDSALIQSAVQGADAIVLLLSSELTSKVVPELRAAGFTGKMSSPTTLVDEVTVKQIGGKEASKIALAGQFFSATDKSHPGVKRFNADMDKYEPETRRIEASLMVWTAMHVVADALAHAPTVDAAGLITALNTYKVNLDVGPEIDFSNGGNVYGIPRIFTPLVNIQHITKDAKYIEDAPFFDPTQPPTKK